MKINCVLYILIDNNLTDEKTNKYDDYLKTIPN